MWERCPRRCGASNHSAGFAAHECLQRVLGLGDIGPEASMPVMEGKASLLETLTGLSGMPVLLDTKDAEEQGGAKTWHAYEV